MRIALQNLDVRNPALLLISAADVIAVQPFAVPPVIAPVGRGRGRGRGAAAVGVPILPGAIVGGGPTAIGDFGAGRYIQEHPGIL